MIDYKRLFGGLLILLVVQWVGELWLFPIVMTIIPGYPGLIISTAVIYYFCAFFLNLFYVPSGYRKSAMRTPEFHRQVLTYFMIFFVISIIQMFVF